MTRCCVRAATSHKHKLLSRHYIFSATQTQLSVLNTVAPGHRLYPIITCSRLPFLPLASLAKVIFSATVQTDLFYILILHYAKDTSSSGLRLILIKRALARLERFLNFFEELCVKLTFEHEVKMSQRPGAPIEAANI